MLCQVVIYEQPIRSPSAVFTVARGECPKHRRNDVRLREPRAKAIAITTTAIAATAIMM
jgi:hypothetical protein